jgi:hypothetical protein
VNQANQVSKTHALPDPMLARSGHLPYRDGYAYEPKWDGLRALVRSGSEFRVHSRRGWNMSARVPELAALPVDAVLDGPARRVVSSKRSLTANRPAPRPVVEQKRRFSMALKRWLPRLILPAVLLLVVLGTVGCGGGKY